jgi:hypothetical protein
MAAAADPASRRVVTRDDAERILLGLTAALDDLEAALEIETALIGAGRIRDGLAAESRKAELSAAYVLQLQHAKAQIVALARLAPEALRRFRERQAAFERVMSRNQTVIATARAVAEGLIRGLSEAVEREVRPNVYGLPSRPPAPANSAAPLVFSGRY